LAVTVTAVHVVETIPRSVSIQKRFPQEEMNRREELADMLKTTFVEAIRRALRSGGGRAGGLIVIIGLGDCESNKHSVYHSLCVTGNDLTRTLVFDAVCFLA
jgi:hypothetical protein